MREGFVKKGIISLSRILLGHERTTVLRRTIGRLLFSLEWPLSIQVRLIPRMLTHPIRVMPDFIIIGVQRGGTTSLYNYLVEHPCVAPTLTKEIHFFDVNFGKGIGWYRAFFPTLVMKCWHEKIRKRDFITGESSPYYLFHPHAARRAFETIPRAKIIALLRNPVDRALSSHNMQKGLGVETLSFKEAVEREEERLRGELERMLEDENYNSFAHVKYSYLSRGIYVDQLKVWMSFFPRDQILILRSEDLYSDPATTLEEVFKFLNLPIWKMSEYKKYNYAPHKPMDAATRKHLVEYFKPHNQRLYEYLGIEFDWDN